MAKIKVTLEYLESIVFGSEPIGFCKNCGYEQYGVEPDAEKYECEECGEHEVYGAELLMFMDELEIE